MPTSDHVQELQAELLAMRETSSVSKKGLVAASGRVPCLCAVSGRPHSLKVTW